MADLVTHVATALLWKAATRRPAATLVIGVALPDLAGRVPTMLLSPLALAGWPIPDALVYGFNAIHTPFGILALTLLLSLCFREDQRKEAWANLAGGGALHMGVDLLQHHVGVGYPLLLPFSGWHWEAGLIGTEATVKVAPVLGPLSLALWLWRRPRAAQPEQGTRIPGSSGGESRVSGPVP